jgi:pimeloyl-ACP methyl ester carboxylesterase
MKYLEKNLLVIPSSSSSSKEDHAMGQSHSLSKRNHRQLDISGVISMCSVPPSGNGKMTMRFLKRSLRDSWKITAGLAMKKCIRDRELCRELFFGSELEDGISDEDVSRFQQYFERDTVATIDLMDLAKRLPSVQTDDSGKAIFWEDDRDLVIPSLVIGATDDFIVDKEGVEEVARYYGVEPIMVDSAHDVMLGSRWENGAKVILDFLEENFMVEK